MAKWIHVYEYEDHTYPTQARAREVLGSNVCKQSSHIWRYVPVHKNHGERIALHGTVETCSCCGMIRFYVKNPNSYR